MKNKTSITTRFRNAIAPALVGAASLLFAATSASGQNLISWYTLNGDGIDQGSIGANGTLTGTASFVNDGPGIYNQSLGLNGSPGYLGAPTGTAFDGLEQMTITLWVNVQGALGGTGDRLVSNLGSKNDDYPGFDFRFNGSGSADNFDVMFSAGGSSGATSSDIKSSNDWVFLAVTYDSTLDSKHAKFYWGDEAVAAGLLNESDHDRGAIRASNRDLRIGSTPASTDDRTPPAYISDVRIFGGVLSLEQIEDIRASVAVIPEPAHFAAIFGGIILAMLYLRRRKS